MGIKLRIISSTLLTLMMFSCKTTQSIVVDKEEDTYVLAYKKAVLFGCIDEATDGEFQKFSSNNNDLDIAVEVGVLYHFGALEAKKIGAKLSSKIKAVNYDDYEGRKPIYSDCVSYAFSKEIDSSARMQFKKSKQ